MNTSYKIVLLGAFVLFTAVIGYYALSDSDEPTPEVDDSNPLAARTPDIETPEDPPETPRTSLPTTPPTPPTPPDEPGVIIDAPDEEPLDFRIDDSPPTDDTTPPPGDSSLALGETPGPEDPELGLERGTPGTFPDDLDTPVRPTDPDDGLSRGPLTDIDDDSGVPPTDTEIEALPPDRPLPRYPGDANPSDADPADDDPPATDTPSRTARTYTVQPGDTFASIAIEVYGEEKAWFDIAQANPSIDPKRLQVGQVIALPDLSDDGASDDPAPPAPGTDQTYTVRPGDNLSRIAKKFYGDTEQWELIYSRNRDKIGPRPDNIKVGMVLIIPQAFNGAE